MRRRTLRRQPPTGGRTHPFHDAGPFDRFDLDVLIEVKSKFFADRAEGRQSGADAILAAAQAALGTDYQIGVYLTLPVAAWSQTAVS